MQSPEPLDNPDGRPLISVIIPAFNSEKTVERAVRSVLGQSVKDLQVIVIDDGSADNTLQKLQELQDSARDRRLSVIALPDNRGVSNARNLGVSAAKGIWLAFLDADDAWDHSFAESTMSQVDDETDAVVVGHHVVDTSGASRQRIPPEGGPLSGEVAAGMVLTAQLSSYLWDKVIRKSLFDNAGVEFSGKLPIAEDVAVLVPVIWGAKRVITVPRPLVTYYVSASSTTWSTDYSPELGMEIVNEIAGNLDSIGVDATTVPQVTVKKVTVLLDVANAAARIGDPIKRKAYIARIRSLLGFRDIMVTAKQNLFFALAAILLKASPFLYRKLYGTYTKKMYAL